MRLTTTYQFNAKPENLWPYLFNSKMDKEHPCFFLCGLPKPVECRLPGGEGGVGATRECISDKGIIHQEITQWKPNQLLEFRMKETSIYFSPCVTSINERFEIVQTNETTTTITRRTDFTLTSSAKFFLSIPMSIGLKSIHHYVFRNWKRLAEQQL